MRQIPQTTIPNPNAQTILPNPANGASGAIGGAVQPSVRGVRRDFTYTPLFNPALTINGQTGIPRG